MLLKVILCYISVADLTTISSSGDIASDDIKIN